MQLRGNLLHSSMSRQERDGREERLRTCQEDAPGEMSTEAMLVMPSPSFSHTSTTTTVSFRNILDLLQGCERFC